MKKKEMKAALEALRKIKMPSIEDKKLRNGIIKDHLSLLRAQKAYERDIRNLDTVHFGAFAEEREEVAKLQQQLGLETDTEKKIALVKEIESHTELFDAVKAFNKDIDALGDEKVEILGIPQAEFLEEIVKQDFDLVQLEALEPMFIDESDNQ